MSRGDRRVAESAFEYEEPRRFLESKVVGEKLKARHLDRTSLIVVNVVFDHGSRTSNYQFSSNTPSLIRMFERSTFAKFPHQHILKQLSCDGIPILQTIPAMEPGHFYLPFKIH